MLILGGNPLASNGSIMTVPDVEKRLKAMQAGAGAWWWSTRGAAKRRRWPISICSSAPVAMRFVRLLNTLFENLARGSHLPVNGLERVREAIAPFMPRR
jgi:hypothetical protein